MGLRILQSNQDQSVNFIEKALEGFLESRYVRKTEDYFIAYLSSQTGCNRGCSFCHLTSTGQLSFIDSTQQDFLRQARQVIQYYRSLGKPARYMHYNFMARGEPLCNKTILNSGDELLAKLGALAKQENLPAKFNISTILPLTFKGSLVETFPYITPTIYYSLYSMDDVWRKVWMPGAMPAVEGLRLLKEYQDFSKKIIKIHYPLIRGENDSREHAYQVEQAIRSVNLQVEFNLVRYNPSSPEQGQESTGPMIDAYLDQMRRLRGKVQVIPRVGFDVSASCGMFSSKEV